MRINGGKIEIKPTSLIVVLNGRLGDIVGYN